MEELTLEDQHSNVGVSLLQMHRCITRGIATSVLSSQIFHARGFPDIDAHDGFINYLRSLVSVLDAHHLLEDEILFPCFKGVIPEAPYDLLTFHHKIIIPFIEEIQQITNQVAENEYHDKPLNQLNTALTNLEKIWLPHIFIEEMHFTPEAIEDLLSKEVHGKLSIELAEYSQQKTGPDYLVTPFILYNLSPKDRESFSRNLPPIVMQELIPITWKEKWQSMKPFLLD